MQPETPLWPNLLMDLTALRAAADYRVGQNTRVSCGRIHTARQSAKTNPRLRFRQKP